MERGAVALDDGKSDATSIAYAVNSRCSAEIDAALQAHADPWWPAAVYYPYMEGGRKKSLGIATEIVLKERRGQ
jgi:hypothetical protein